MSALWAVVPVKELRHAKARLAGALDPQHRRVLMLAMLEDVLGALARAPALDGIIVATLDPDAAAAARRFGAAILREAAGEGHTEAVAAAARLLAKQGSAMMTLPADIPLLRPEDVAAVAACGKDFVIVPSRDGTGTNAVLCAPADLVPLRFGAPSFVAHLAAARARGIAPHVLDLPRVALDIDEPADLAALAAAPDACRAREVLALEAQR